ncbi:hypothetical protein DFH06DRAFT_1123414 [Mycena polygramma]|nr:hypothetical protein DFH06DRAFT_1123414 [Mycena polygramma]
MLKIKGKIAASVSLHAPTGSRTPIVVVVMLLALLDSGQRVTGAERAHHWADIVKLQNEANRSKPKIDAVKAIQFDANAEKSRNPSCPGTAKMRSLSCSETWPAIFVQGLLEAVRDGDGGKGGSAVIGKPMMAIASGFAGDGPVRERFAFTATKASNPPAARKFRGDEYAHKFNIGLNFKDRKCVRTKFLNPGGTASLKSEIPPMERPNAPHKQSRIGTKLMFDSHWRCLFDSGLHTSLHQVELSGSFEIHEEEMFEVQPQKPTRRTSGSGKQGRARRRVMTHLLLETIIKLKHTRIVRKVQIPEDKAWGCSAINALVKMLWLIGLRGGLRNLDNNFTKCLCGSSESRIS